MGKNIKAMNLNHQNVQVATFKMCSLTIIKQYIFGQ